MCIIYGMYCTLRDHFVYAPSQWEATLHCNVVSHWLGTYTKWSLYPWYLIASKSPWCCEVCDGPNASDATWNNRGKYTPRIDQELMIWPQQYNAQWKTTACFMGCIVIRYYCLHVLVIHVKMLSGVNCDDCFIYKLKTRWLTIRVIFYSFIHSSPHG